MAKTDWKYDDIVDEVAFNALSAEVNQNAAVSSQLAVDLYAMAEIVIDHTKNKSNPHVVTTEQVNKITAKLVGDLPSAYPIGLSVFSLSASLADPWKVATGHVGEADKALIQTAKVTGDYLIAQRVTFDNSGTGVTGVYERISSANNSWDGAWVKVVSRSEFETVKADLTAHKADYAKEVGKVFNVKGYGATGSQTTTTGSITSGFAFLEVSDIKDFKVGQGVRVSGAGASGAPLYSTIFSVDGLTLTLTSAAGTTVSGATIEHDDANAIHAAIAACAAAGGGEVRFEAKRYNHRGLKVGDGTGITVESSYNFIRLVGAGRGIDSQAKSACTSLRYRGLAGGTAIEFDGLIVGCEISKMRIEGVLTAGKVVHMKAVQQSKFSDINIIDPQAGGIALHLDAGCAINLWQSFSIVAQAPGACGVKLTGTIAADRADVCRQTFIAGDIFHSGDTVTGRGLWLEQADNNTFVEMAIIPNGAVNNPLGKSIYIDQVAAPDQVFSHENVFINVAPLGGVDGTGGEGGNWFLPYPTSDGQAAPIGDNFHSLLYDGRMMNGNKQRRSIRQIYSMTATDSVSNNTTTYALVQGMTKTLTIKANSKIRVTFSARVSKGTAGEGFFAVAINASVQGHTTRSTPSTPSSNTIMVETIIDIGAGTHTIEIYYKSSDTNAVFALQREMIVEELY